MAASRAVVLVSHGRGSGGRSIATPGTSWAWPTNRGGHARVAAGGSAQAAVTSRTMPAIANLMAKQPGSNGGMRYPLTISYRSTPGNVTTPALGGETNDDDWQELQT